MTILDKMNKSQEGGQQEVGNDKVAAPNGGQQPKGDEAKRNAEPNNQTDASQLLSQVESQFTDMMAEFRANAGFSVNTGEQPYSTMIELLSSVGVNASITVLLSFIRYCINHNLKKEITVRIGYNKPTSIPMNFAVNERLLEEIYPGDTIEIN